MAVTAASALGVVFIVGSNRGIEFWRHNPTLPAAAGSTSLLPRHGCERVSERVSRSYSGRGTLALVVLLSASAVSDSLIEGAGMVRRRALA